MTKREMTFYRKLYVRPRSKRELAELFSVSTKTVDNTAAKLSEDIIYDRKIGTYRFVKLLPRWIPVDTFLKVFSTLLDDKALNTDLLLAGTESIKAILETGTLTPLTKNILKAEVAIGSYCIIEMQYGGVDKPPEMKIVRPHKVFGYRGTHYLHATYDERNGKNPGERRTFSFSGIESIEAIEFVPAKKESFRMEGEFSPYGEIDRQRHILLRISGQAAGYFRRERLFATGEYEYVSEEADGSLLTKKYYNSDEEVVRLVQSWMPDIEILGDMDFRRKVLGEILDNASRLAGNEIPAHAEERKAT